MRPIFVSLLLFIGVSVSVCPTLLADPPATTRPSELALEIEALRALDDLQATPAQIDQLREASADATDGAAAPAADAAEQLTDLEGINHAATDNRVCYVTLLRLREGLLSDDPAKTEQGEKELSDLEEKFQTSFVPRVVPTPAAQRSAVGIMGQFSGQQIAAYMAQRSEEISDPTEVLLGAITQCRGMEPADFRQFNHDVSLQVAEIVAGMGRPRVQRAVAIEVANLLRKAHNLNEGAFDDQRSSLEDQAHAIITVDAPTALRHWMECEIAQLISNPQLPSALSDRSLWADRTSSISSGEQ